MILGMAGLAEAALAQALAVLFVGLVVMWCLLAIAYRKGPVGLAFTIVVLIIFSAIFFEPWTGFFPVRSEDHGVHYWAARLRVIDLIWWLTFGASIALWVLAKRRRNQFRRLPRSNGSVIVVGNR